MLLASYVDLALGILFTSSDNMAAGSREHLSQVVSQHG